MNILSLRIRTWLVYSPAVTAFFCTAPVASSTLETVCPSVFSTYTFWVDCAIAATAKPIARMNDSIHRFINDLLFYLCVH